MTSVKRHVLVLSRLSGDLFSPTAPLGCAYENSKHVSKRCLFRIQSYILLACVLLQMVLLSSAAGVVFLHRRCVVRGAANGAPWNPLSVPLAAGRRLREPACSTSRQLMRLCLIGQRLSNISADDTGGGG